jgi:ADP-ribose pyrophosphatase YjhB (NUDIX family)
VKIRRKYPSRPIVGAGAVVHRGTEVLLLKRRYPPNRGRWALPGGLVELGERVEDAAAREILEETGLAVQIDGLVDVETDLHRDRASKLEYHYVLVDYLAKPIGGAIKLNAESSDYGWFTAAEVKDLDVSRGTRKVLETFFSRRPDSVSRSARRPTGMRSS